MIEQDLETALRKVAAVMAVVGTRVYFLEVPNDTTRPYCAFQVMEGRRTRISYGKTEDNTSFRFYVDSADMASGLLAAQAIRGYLDEFRGAMESSSDMYIKSGDVVSLAIDSGYRFSFDVDVKRIV